ncbi:MAG: (Na+)-NQR maturation NqrM [Alcanivoracaceae bacterium]
MIETIIASILVFAVLIVAMAVGVIFSNKPIKGSCGGLNALGMKENCEICGGEPSKCDEQVKAAAGKPVPQAYDANKRTF